MSDKDVVIEHVDGGYRTDVHEKQLSHKVSDAVILPRKVAKLVIDNSYDPTEWRMRVVHRMITLGEVVT